MCQAAFDLGPLVDQLGMFALAETRSAGRRSTPPPRPANRLWTPKRGTAGTRAVTLQRNLAGAIANTTPGPLNFSPVATRSDGREYGLRRNNRIFAGIFSRAATVEPSSRNLTTENGQIDPRSATLQINATTTMDSPT